MGAELFPCVSSLATQLDQPAELGLHFRPKARLIGRFRELARDRGEVSGRIAQLRSADAVATCTAVVTDGPESETPAEMASLLVNAIKEGVPLVE